MGRMMEQADDLHVVYVQIPTTVLARQKLTLDEKCFARIEEEWALSAPLTEDRRQK